MRGRRKNESLKSGRTIVAERERAISESERLQERKKVQRRHKMSFVIAVLVLAILGLGGYLAFKEFYSEEIVRPEVAETEKFEPTVSIIDEDNKMQISSRVKEYVGKIERDLRDLGYGLTKVTIPTGTTRTLYLDVVGKDYFIKVNLDRDTAVSAEDAVRMIKYLEEHDVKPGYVDVRVEGKGYYK